MPTTFDGFSDKSSFSLTDRIVGFDAVALNGEKKWTYSTLLKSLSTDITVVKIQDTAPSPAKRGDIWFDSSSGVTNLYYDTQWVDIGGGDSGTSAGSVNGIVECDGNGNFSAAVAGTDYLTSANFTGTNQSKTTNGYQKLPGGLIIQWGGVNLVGQSSTALNYSIAFPTTVLGVSVAPVATGGDNWAIISGISSLTQITLGREWSGFGTNETNWCYYIVIGY